MARALVTGASGFIGAHLVAALAARGDDVTCLLRKTSQGDVLHNCSVRRVCGDVTDAESVAAAVAGHRWSITWLGASGPLPHDSSTKLTNRAC